MLKINISKKAQKFLLKVPTKHARQLKVKIQELRLNPQPNDFKHLSGHSPYCRVDAGEYRIIYKIDKHMLYIALVGKRNDDDVYRKLNRML